MWGKLSKNLIFPSSCQISRFHPGVCLCFCGQTGQLLTVWGSGTFLLEGTGSVNFKARSLQDKKSKRTDFESISLSTGFNFLSRPDPFWMPRPVYA